MASPSDPQSDGDINNGDGAVPSHSNVVNKKESVPGDMGKTEANLEMAVAPAEVDMPKTEELDKVRMVDASVEEQNGNMESQKGTTEHDVEPSSGGQGSMTATASNGGTVEKEKEKEGEPYESRASTRKASGSTSSGVEAPSPSPSPLSKQKKPVKQKEKKSGGGFWSAFKRVLLPCIGPSKAHDLDQLPDNVNNNKAQSKQRKPSPPLPSSASEKTSSPMATNEKIKSKQEPLSPPTNGEIEKTDFVDNRPLPIDTDLPLTVTHTAPPTPSRRTLSDQNKEVIVPPTPPSHLLPPDETAGVTSGAVQPPGSTGEEPRDDGDGYDEDADTTGDTLAGTGIGLAFSEEEEEERLIMQGGAGIPIGPDGEPRPLLPQILPAHDGRKCLVLDLDETLVHSSFKLIPQADYVVPVEIEHQYHNVYVIKRPGVDQFLQRMGELYEIVVFTASLSKYADPVLDKLDVSRVVTHRLFRESCYNHKGNYVKDLSQLGRPIEHTIILDNSPASYIFHPNNAVPVSSWFNDPHDTELTDLCPFLNDLRHVDDVRGILDGGL